MSSTRSDCGCNHAVAAENPSRARMDVVGSGTNDVTAADAGATVVLDGFRALNPVDGLFLRAAHLKQIQDYARALTGALATSAGAGVVYGLGVRLVTGALEVSPGLAVSNRGALLLLASTARIPLDETHLPALPKDGFWRVEVHPASGTSGSAPVYGSLCNDNCADGAATIAPWLDEGVELRLVADALPGFDATPLNRRRNWLASAYFERERASGQPWTVPVGPGAPVSLWSHDWGDDTPLPAEAGVPLGLLRSDPGYGLDVWAARRIIGGPAADATWLGHLGMRPWAVFLAQILQFEAEFSDDDGDLAGPGPLETAAQEFLDAVKEHDPLRRRDTFQHLEAASRRSSDGAARASRTAASSLGELPPAGFLNLPGSQKQFDWELHAFFGPNVDVRVRRLRADQVGDEILAAQSRDRIPLEPRQGQRPQVDVLVPAEAADLPALYTAAYDWVAFVRRGPEQAVEVLPAPATEDVRALLLILGDEWLDVLQKFDFAYLKRADEFGTLTFPKGGWAYPGSDVALKMLDTVTGKEASIVAVIGVATRGDHPLAAERAGLFGMSLGGGQPLRCYGYPDAGTDAILVVATTIQVG